MAPQEGDNSSAGFRGRSLNPVRKDQDSQDRTELPVSVLLIPAPDQAETPERMTLNDLRLSTTVGELRQRAQAIIASQPDLGRLRLIHSGRLLSRDEQTLADLVGFEAAQPNSIIAIHLILRPLPGTQRSQPLPRSASPARATAPTGAVSHQQGTPLLQPVPARGFPPRPSSTPAMPQAHGPYALPAHQQAPGGFASHGVPNAQQAQFMHQLQQQHLNMMQAMLRQNPLPHQPITQGNFGHQMTLPDFQRIYNQQAQARQAQQAQQAASSGRTTPQGVQHLGRPSGIQTIPNDAHLRTDGQNVPDTLLQHHAHGLQRTGQANTATPAPATAPRVQLNSHILQPMSTSQPTNYSSGFSPEYDTVFLLSSPTGHEAILLGPRAPHDSLTAQRHTGSTGPAVGLIGTQPLNPAVVGQHNAQAPAEAPARPAAPGQPLNLRDLLAIMMPFGGQLWLIVRLAGVVALLTLHASWSRTLLIWLIAFIIYLAQTEVLNPFQRAAEQVWIPVRRHIEELVRDAEDQQQGLLRGDLDPAQAATRLLRRQRDQSILRRVERSVALFVASFVPGVGEAQVAAREAADRRRAQEERARIEEAERARQQEESASSAVDVSTTQQGQTQHESAPEYEATGLERGVGTNESIVRQRQPHVEDVDE